MGNLLSFNPKIHSLRAHSKEFCRLLYSHRRFERAGRVIERFRVVIWVLSTRGGRQSPPRCALGSRLAMASLGLTKAAS
jgi:hypothetical protein